MFEPFYTNYNGFAAMTSVECVPVTTRGEDGYHLPDRAAIEAKIGPRTRAILICSPNNPTGTVYTDAEIETLAADLPRPRPVPRRGRGLPRVHLRRQDQPLAADAAGGSTTAAIVVDSVSKRYSLCGARIGNIVSRNRAFMDAILRFGQARLCPPDAGAVRVHGAHRGAGVVHEGVVAEYQKRRDVVFEALSRMPGVRVRRPEGAFYICTGLPVDDANAFAIFLLASTRSSGETVMVAPARRLLRHAGAGPRRGAAGLRARVRQARTRDEDPGRGADGVRREGEGLGPVGNAPRRSRAAVWDRS